MISKYINWGELVNEELLSLSLDCIITTFDWLSGDEIDLFRVFLDELEDDEIELTPSECTCSLAKNKELIYNIIYTSKNESNDRIAYNYILVLEGNDFELASIKYEGV